MFFRPKTLNEAIGALTASGGQILSGGTDFFPALGDMPVAGSVVDISTVEELRGIRLEQNCVRIGGLTTWTEIIESALPKCFDALKAAAREVGSIQIQNRGTVAGNICNASPAADGIPPLLALDAEVELISSRGARRMPLSDFITGNRKTQLRAGEILSTVIVPREMDEAASAFLKLGTRRYLVISISMVAAIIKTDGTRRVVDARVAVGSCGAKAQRLCDLEQSLLGTRSQAGIGALATPDHLAPLSPIDDVRATAAYRLDASLTLIRRALEACVVA